MATGDEGYDHDLWAQLQADVDARLESTLRTMSAATDLGVAWSTDVASALRQLESDLVSVRQLELRMPIVAPMKSGKSTIINAIVGYDLLPARAEAMTTLPTKIVLTEGPSEPELILCEQVATVFSDLVKEVRPYVSARFSELTERYAHLEQLLTQLKAGRPLPIDGTRRGRHDVLEGLTQLNDLLRLAAILRPDDDYIGRMTDLPVLRAPLPSGSGLGGTGGAGTLAIIDTPGPDESGVAPRLIGAVASQLKSCHVVLLLLDYTAMGREADEKIRDLVEPVVWQIGREKLYVAVNKVDQRRPGDRDVDGVRRFVQRDLDLGDQHADQRVFETKGQQALAAARVLSLYPWTDGTARIRSNAQTEALLRELFSDEVDRQEALGSWTEADLRERAERAWRTSGLPTLLTYVIGRLRTSVVPVVLTSALDKAASQLVTLRGLADLRLKAARDARQRVESELKALEQESRELDKVRSEAPDAKQFGNQIEKSLHEKLNSFSYVGRGGINQLDVYAEETLGHPLTEEPRRSPAFEFFGGVSGAARPVGAAWLGGKRDRSTGLFHFESAEAATEFIQWATAKVLDRLRRLADDQRENLSKTVAELANDAVTEQNEKVRPIVERASRRLSEAFNVQLTVPPLQLADADIDPEPILPLIEEITQKKERTKTDWRRKWYVLWLIKIPVTVRETYDEVIRLHKVDLNALKDQMGAGFDARVAEISEELKHYMVDHLMRELERYFTGVDAYLRQYTQSLEQARADASRDEAEKAEIAQRLSDLVRDAEDHLAAMAALKTRLAG